jgi:DNA repair photolyase
LAAAASPLDQRNVVQYARLPARSILNRCSARSRMPFRWTINPYRGCEFGCQYCYARYTHEFMELRGGYDFERHIFVKQDAAALLARELRRVRAGEGIALGTATDPYQPAERHYEVTRALLEVFARHTGLDLGIITKSALITRDLDLLEVIAARHQLRVRITVTTLDAELARTLEPRAPRPDLRLRAVEQLAAAGLWVGVMCAPVLPAITDSRENLEAVARAARAAGARGFHAGALYLRPAARARYLPFVREHFPHLSERYERAFAGGTYITPAYQHWLAARVRTVRAACGFTGGASDVDRPPAPWPTSGQLSLF